jgi:tRNA pseudouridine38-40 synthase
VKRKYKAVIAYDGTAYSGWQYQDNAIGIQQVVEETLKSLNGDDVRVYGSSRTDAGVHARGFVAHFYLTKPIPPKNLVRAVNARLPDAIRFMKVSFAKDSFDARLSAKGKEYRYHLYQSSICPPHLAPYWTHCHRELDEEAMRKACSYFVGKHDFVAFAANPNRVLETTQRTIFSFDIKKVGPRIVFIVKGDGFLYKQVRSMVGFLISVGKGNESPEAVGELLESKAKRTARVETAPPRGLFLWKVFY